MVLVANSGGITEPVKRPDQTAVRPEQDGSASLSRVLHDPVRLTQRGDVNLLKKPPSPAAGAPVSADQH